jgi:starch synthase
MDILFVSPEVAPFSKAGAVADVASALPKALRALGHNVRVLSLRYGSVDTTQNALARRLAKIAVPLGPNETVQAEVYEARLPSGVHVTLLNAPGLTDREKIYGGDDEARLFAFLSRGAIEWMRAQSKLPDVLHAHDWAAALAPVFLKLAAEKDPALRAVKSVFTLHGTAWQGRFPRASLAATGLPEKLFTPAALEFYGEVNWLKGGLLYADKVTTVSPSYAKEIATGAEGHKLEGVVRSRGEVLGVLDGVDYAVWNPATDPHLVARFNAEDVFARERCRADLLGRVGLLEHTSAPVFGFVGRLDEAKGADVLLAAAPKLLRNDLQLVLLGEGEGPIADGLSELAKRFPDRVSLRRGFDDVLAHRIFAGCDFFLAPSRFEPSGLAAMYAMRYGAVPVARATGGINDTVLDADAELRSGTGFLFDRADADELVGAVGRALAAYQSPEGLRRLRRRVMRRDVSWERSARQYAAVYQSLTAGRAQPEAR